MSFILLIDTELLLIVSSFKVIFFDISCSPFAFNVNDKLLFLVAT